NLSRRECVPGDRRRLLREHDLKTASLERSLVEASVIERPARREREHPMAERVLTAGVERDAWLELSLVDARPVGQCTIVIGVPVADDERIGPGRIELQHRVVVEEVSLGEREVEQDLALLAPARRLEMVRESVLGDRRWDSDAASDAL